MHDTISKSVFKNYKRFYQRIGLGYIAALTRCFSTSRSFYSIRPYNLESLALEHINSGKPTTCSVINKILLNQNLSVTDSKLKELLKVKGIKMDLPISRPENW